MITFMRFDATGRYTATVSCPQECMPHEDDQRIFIGKVDAATHYHDLSTGMPVEMPPKPSKFNRFDYTTKQWIDPRTPEQIASVLQAEIVKATQNRLDTFAQTRNYDGILSACTYATSSVPAFAAEGQYCVASRDATWAALYVILGEVQAGTRAVPTGFADIEGDLPVLGWPA